LLLKGRTNTNAIIKQTGIYKNNVFEAIKYLEKAGLAIRFKDKKVHRQKVFIRLNEFGQQLADFIENAEKFEKSFDDLRNTITRFCDLPKDAEKKVIRSLLLNRGLNRQEIDKYTAHCAWAWMFERDSISVLIDGIVNKYALFKLEFSLNNYAKEFLKEIITRKLSKYLLIRIEDTVKDEYIRSEKYEIDLPKQVATKNRINEMIEKNGFLFFYFLDRQIPYSNRHIRNEVKNIVSSLFSIFHLPMEYVEQKIKNPLTPRGNPYLDEDKDEVRSEVRSAQREIYSYVAELNTSA
jgi:hypothetical protein